MSPFPSLSRFYFCFSGSSFLLYIVIHWGLKFCHCRPKLSLKRRTPPSRKMTFRVPSMSSQQLLNAVTASAWIWLKQKKKAIRVWTSIPLQGKAALGKMGGKRVPCVPQCVALQLLTSLNLKPQVLILWRFPNREPGRASLNLAIIHVGLSMGPWKNAHVGIYRAREQHEKPKKALGTWSFEDKQNKNKAWNEFFPFRVERHGQGALYKLNYCFLSECLAA